MNPEDAGQPPAWRRDPSAGAAAGLSKTVCPFGWPALNEAAWTRDPYPLSPRLSRAAAFRTDDRCTNEGRTRARWRPDEARCGALFPPPSRPAHPPDREQLPAD